MHNGPNRAPCIGRHKGWYHRQQLLRKHEYNHIRRLERHIKRCKDDSSMAIQALKKYRELLKT